MSRNIILKHCTLGLLYSLLLTKVQVLNGKSVEFIFTGDACECPRELPYEIGVPIVQQVLPPTPKDHFYKIEVPAFREAQVKYSLDFEIEQPTPPVPPIPLGRSLSAKVDRIQLPKPDCPHYVGRSCSCGTMPCSCGMKPCNVCGFKPCSCRPKLCSCGSTPCNCGSSKLNFPFINSLIGNDDYFPGPKYHVPVNYLRVRRDLNEKKFSIKKWMKTMQTRAKAGFKKEEKHKKKHKKREINEINENIHMLDRVHGRNLDLRIPEILQYMPEVMSSKFELGECFGCNNNNNNNQSNFTPQATSYSHQFTCTPTITPVDYIASYVKYVHDSPVSYELQENNSKKLSEEKYINNETPKYKKNNSRLKQVRPKETNHNNDPVVGASADYESKLEELIKQIVYSHPDFIAASDYGDGILTPSAQSQNRQAMAFLRRIIVDRMSKWFKKRRKDNGFENYSSSEESISFERPYRSSDIHESVLDPQVEEESNRYSSKERPAKLLSNLHTGRLDSDLHTGKEKLVKSLKGNEVHLVKFKRDGKTLQILTSQSNHDNEHSRI